MENDDGTLKKTHDKLYTKIVDEFADKFSSDYSLSSYSQALKYFFSYLSDTNKNLEDMNRDTIWGFIEERYKNGNSMDTIFQYLERVHFLLENYSEIYDVKRINYLFLEKFLNSAIVAIAEETTDRSFGNYKKNKNETTLATDPKKLRDIFDKFHPRS